MSEFIPRQRIAEKLDAYMQKRDYAAAEAHLLYWLAEARLLRDARGELYIDNELMGFYRKTAQREKALEAAESGLSFMETLDISASLEAGTCYINAATVFVNFGMPARALDYFNFAKRIYEAELPEGDARLGTLYNNMAQAYAAERRFGEAYELFTRAIRLLEKLPGTEPERAMTYLNMADATCAEHGPEKAEKKINQYLEWAEALLDMVPADAGTMDLPFVFEKCADVFDYYGWFLTAAKLRKRVEGGCL